MNEPETPSSNDEEKSYNERRNARLGVPAGYTLHEPFMDFWPNVVLGISIAGAFWPFAMFVFEMLQRTSGNSIFSLAIYEMILAGLVQFLFGGTICLIVIGLVAAAIALAANLILNTLRVDCEHLLVGTATGGVVGLVVALPFCFVEDTTYIQCLLALVEATLLAQLGGTWGAWRALYRSRSAKEIAEVLPTNIQFGMRQMLLLTVWCTLILTGLKLAGVLSERLLVLAAVWFALQVILLVVGAALGRRWRRKSLAEPTSLAEAKHD